MCLVCSSLVKKGQKRFAVEKKNVPHFRGICIIMFKKYFFFSFSEQPWDALRQVGKQGF